ncbi:MAG: phage holin family protein [Zoogloeaceae bacterium]|jgi:uncharacterized membrane protein YqjE|nr:phage holin family protein [Zoogloeaceae bacterium]
MMANDRQTRATSRLFGNLRLALADLLENGRLRFALLANEAEEARIRLIHALICILLALAALVVSIVLLVGFCVLLFREHPLVVLGLFSAFFFMAAVVLALRAHTAIGARPFFSTSLAELQTDVETLRAEAAETHT